jgi:hypothetical protein
VPRRCWNITFVGEAYIVGVRMVELDGCVE